MPKGFQVGAFQSLADGFGFKGFQAELSVVTEATQFKVANIDSTVELPADHFRAQLVGAKFFNDARPGDRLTIRLGYRIP